MSVREEQYRSVRETRRFLFRLLNTKETPRVPSTVREEAKRLLKHYPMMDTEGKPAFSKE